MRARVINTLPVLHWADAPGMRVLYAGNHPDHIAEIEYDDRRIVFRVLLPGKEFPPDRSFASAAAAEAFVSSVCEAWFKAVYA